MIESQFSLGYQACRALLQKRLTEPAPGRIHSWQGPRAGAQAQAWEDYLLGGPASV